MMVFLRHGMSQLRLVFTLTVVGMSRVANFTGALLSWPEVYESRPLRVKGLVASFNILRVRQCPPPKPRALSRKSGKFLPFFVAVVFRQHAANHPFVLATVL